MSTTAILSAALERLLAFTYSPQPAIVWPGIQETPPEEGLWLEPGFFPNEPEDISWDDDGCVETRGFFQVLVHYRPGTGQVEPVTLADAIVSYYPKGFELGPVRVVKRAWQSMPVIDTDDSYIPVTIPYMGLT